MLIKIQPWGKDQIKHVGITFIVKFIEQVNLSQSMIVISDKSFQLYEMVHKTKNI